MVFVEAYLGYRAVKSRKARRKLSGFFCAPFDTGLERAKREKK
jgi:hypothetical protein